MSPKAFKNVTKTISSRCPFLTGPDATLVPWRCRGAGLKRAMALPWRVHQNYELRCISATAPPSALSRRASAMAPARRQARKGKFVPNFHSFNPIL